jgi:nickel-dependent lactate racemase
MFHPAVASAVNSALAALRSARTMTIVVNDPQRSTATRAVLDVLAEQIDLPSCRLLVATGSHRFGPGEVAAHESALGADRMDAVAWHDAQSAELTPVSAGAWRAHSWLLDGMPLLAIGSIEPHYFAGFTGAHKTLTIGCASYGDIEHNHSSALSPACRPCVLADNPVYEGIAGMVRKLAARVPLACINLLQNGDEIAAAAGGEPLATLRALAAMAQRQFVRTVPAPARAVVAHVAGPLGESLYQADKGIKNNEWAVRDGGTLVLSAACSRGIGQDAFAQLLREAATHRQSLDVIARRGYRLGDHKAVRLRYLTDPACRGVQLVIVSDGISQQQAALLGGRKAPSIQAALEGIAAEDVIHVDDAGDNCVLPPGRR